MTSKEWCNLSIWISASQWYALETRQDCLAILTLLQLLEIHREAKELLTSAGTGQHLADCSGKISFDFPNFHGSDVVWEYSHAEMETETRGLLPYVKAQTSGLSSKWVWGENCPSSLPPNWSEKQGKRTRFEFLKWTKLKFSTIQSTNYSTQETSLWIQQLKITFWSKQTLKQLYPTPQYFVQQHTLRNFCK